MTPDQAAARLRKLVIAGQYRQAREALQDYRRALDSSPDAGRLQEALDLLEWARHAVLAGRAQAAAARAALATQHTYDRRTPPEHTWELAG